MGKPSVQMHTRSSHKLGFGSKFSSANVFASCVSG